VERLANGWSYDLVSIGYPGLVLKGRIAAEPHNLAPGWVGFDFARAFGKPAQVVNDAAMHPDEIVVGGGNAKKLKELPPGCRLGDNSNAFIGGFRLWERAQAKARRH
jgi:polyphosphate glucokinase